MARRTKLTPDIQAKIIAAIQAGNYFVTACHLAGVDDSTAREWVARGEGRDPKRHKTKLYAAFAVAVRDAEAVAESQAVAKWQSKISDDWRAAAEFLARRYPDRWSPSNKQEIQHDGEIKVIIEYADSKAGAAPPPSGTETGQG